ncbi:preprotein translocase subunit SecE [Amylibacter sp. SFDW26]|uniref:preprotein translocase subunit SecE n=1 Tax=Amylibacter sp. SFDW26 TaxID=2652722 RepID=UPI0012628CBC|nr:preprotein translocase subunit SecE [Amylibacter sp. SFDW26]KAB7614832.1 preprotein translocase subunit SecE [Amylibacter sp. SFDW26]
MAMANPMQFVQQVRAEVAKVVWPSRRETGITTVMVFIMATIFAIFFSIVDITARSGLDAIVNLAS